MQGQPSSTTPTIQGQPNETQVQAPVQTPSLKVKTHVKAGFSIGGLQGELGFG